MDQEQRENRLAADLAALEALRASIDAMLTRAGPVLFGESRDVLETYRLFAGSLVADTAQPPGRPTVVGAPQCDIDG